MLARTINVSVLDPFQLLLNMLALPTLCLVIQPAVCIFDLYVLTPVLWIVIHVMVLSIVGTGRFVVLTLGSYVAYMLTVKALLYLRVPVILDSLAGLQIPDHLIGNYRVGCLWSSILNDNTCSFLSIPQQ
jgi:hypothetical protein